MAEGAQLGDPRAHVGGILVLGGDGLVLGGQLLVLGGDDLELGGYLRLGRLLGLRQRVQLAAHVADERGTPSRGCLGLCGGGLDLLLQCAVRLWVDLVLGLQQPLHLLLPGVRLTLQRLPLAVPRVALRLQRPHLGLQRRRGGLQLRDLGLCLLCALEGALVVGAQEQVALAQEVELLHLAHELRVLRGERLAVAGGLLGDTQLHAGVVKRLADRLQLRLEARGLPLRDLLGALAQLQLAALQHHQALQLQ